MRHPAGALGLALMLLSSAGSAEEPSPTAFPPPECRGRDGQILPEARDPVPTTGPTDRPVVLSSPVPRPPRPPRGCEVPPRIWVQAVVTTKGEVCATAPLLPVPEECSAYGELAVKAVRKWKFKPLVRDGKQVAFLYYVGVGFQQGRPAPP